MTVNTLTLYMPGSSVGIQVAEGSQLHLIYASMGATATPGTTPPTVRPDPFPYYVNEDELAAAGIGTSDGAVAALVADDASATAKELRAAFVPRYASIAALRAEPAPGALAITAGYFNAGDGGGGTFRWDSTDTTSTNDGGTVLAPTSAASGRWKRVYEGPVNARWFGVNPSQTDNTAALQAAINYLSTADAQGYTGGELHIPAGYYMFTFGGGLSTITVGANNISITGEGRHTVLAVHSSSTVSTFFTLTQSGVRGQGGGIRDLCVHGRSKLNWVIFLDAWRAWELANVSVMDVFAGILDACNNQTVAGGENILVRHVDYIPSSGTGSCFSRYGVRFRAGTIGNWTECTVRDSLFVNVWDTGVVLDGCLRCTVNQIGAANNQSSSNTIDGSTRAGILHAVQITNSVVGTHTADTGYHVIDSVYMESHFGTETTTLNNAVWIDTPASQTSGLNRFNLVRNVAISTSAGPGIFRITNTSATSGLTSFNVFESNRRAINTNQIQVGPNVTDTSIYLTHNRGQLYKILDQGARTYLNGVQHYSFGGSYPAPNLSGLAQVDTGLISRDTATGRVVWQDKNNVPVLIGPRPGADVVSPYGAQRIRSLATPVAPVISSGNPGSTTWTYYVVAVDKDGNKTPPSPAGTIVNGAASLAGSSQNTIAWMPVDGAVTYDLLRGDTGHSVATGLTTCFYQDNAASTSVYTPSAVSPKGTLTVDDHLFVASATVPTIAAGAAAGTAPTVSISGTDQDGMVTITTGTAPTTGVLATITFGSPFAAAPKIPLIGRASGNLSSNNVYPKPSGLSTTAWTLDTDVALAASTTYSFAYHVAG